MSSIEIRKVTDKKGLKAFIELHYELYKGSPYDAPNLYSDQVAQAVVTDFAIVSCTHGESARYLFRRKNLLFFHFFY